jgi:hypothetical protein
VNWQVIQQRIENLSPAMREEALRLLDDPDVEKSLIIGDFATYAKAVLKIRTKDKGIQPLRLNTAQRYLHKQIEAQKARMGRVRAIGLKGRQQGFSTYVEGRFYWIVSNNHGLQAYILTHEQTATDNLFGMARRYHDYAPAGYKPPTESASAKELVFRGMESSYKVGTAGSKATGRSGTIQLLHGSESAYWPNAQEHFAGVMQCVPNAKGTEIILESTANGIGGEFHNRWIEAGNKDSDYIRIFVPWHWQIEYRSDPNGMKFTAAEKRLQSLYKLDSAQMAWRRRKIAELGSVLMFQQEYPFNSEEAFIVSGRIAFDGLILKELQRECYKPRKTMAFDQSAKAFHDHATGELSVWEMPKPDRVYVIGADVAEGLAHGDYSCADVLDKDGRQVAQWHGHCAPDVFGLILNALGMMYNKAFLGVERNNHGLTTLTVLRDLNYPNLYAQMDIEDRDTGDLETRKIGWLTTSKSKPLIIDNLVGETRDEESGIVCAETVSEMMTYRVDEQGRFGAQQGCFDDRVMSRAIAGQMLRASYVR